MIINKNSCSQKDLETLARAENLKLENKRIDFRNVLVKKPWGHEYLLFENDHVAIWILHINALSKTSMHAHLEKNTSLICLNGEINCHSLDETFSCQELDGINLAKKVFHQTINETQKEAIIMEIETPVNKFDLVRFQDDYGRENKEYECSESYERSEDLTIEMSSEKAVQRNFEQTIVEIGFSKSKEEFLKMCQEEDEKVLITLLNRNIWSKQGQKIFNVGQVLVYGDELFDSAQINDQFVYLILKRK